MSSKWIQNWFFQWGGRQLKSSLDWTEFMYLSVTYYLGKVTKQVKEDEQGQNLIIQKGTLKMMYVVFHRNTRALLTHQSNQNIVWTLHPCVKEHLTAGVQIQEINTSPKSKAQYSRSLQTLTSSNEMESAGASQVSVRESDTTRYIQKELRVDADSINIKQPELGIRPG